MATCCIMICQRESEVTYNTDKYEIWCSCMRIKHLFSPSDDDNWNFGDQVTKYIYHIIMTLVLLKSTCILLSIIKLDFPHREWLRANSWISDIANVKAIFITPCHHHSWGSRQGSAYWHYWLLFPLLVHGIIKYL